MNTSQADELRHLARPDGRVAYSVAGAGPLVICTPGMGDLRSVYRDFAGPLIAAGFRVAVADLRGHGDSDTTFTSHGDAATGGDVLALVRHLGGPAVLVGSSMGGAAALWAAAESPEDVAGVVLLGAFVRDAPGPARRAAVQRLAVRLALLRPWGPAAWAASYRWFNLGRDPHAKEAGRAVKGRLAPWFDEHVAEIRAALRDPAHLRSFRTLVGQLTHRVVEERLGDVRAPALAILGAQDPDFPDPAEELAFVASSLEASGAPVRTVLVPECGHYPHAQRPDVVAPEALAFLAELPRSGQAWAAPAGRRG